MVSNVHITASQWKYGVSNKQLHVQSSNKDPFLMTCIGYKLTMKTPERHC